MLDPAVRDLVDAAIQAGEKLERPMRRQSGSPIDRIDRFNNSFAAAMADAKLKERDLHFHDLQGAAATKFYIAGLSERVIAEIMGWEEPQVAKIIRRYVSRTAATKAIIRQIDQAKART